MWQCRAVAALVFVTLGRSWGICVFDVSKSDGVLVVTSRNCVLVVIDSDCALKVSKSS